MNATGASAEMCGRLHEQFCRLSGRDEDIRFHQRAWHELLHDKRYAADEAALACDVAFVVWYLRKQIGKQKRNPGSLKLRNLLQLDQFLADLAEAKEQEPGMYRRHRSKHGRPLAESKPAPAGPVLSPEEEERLRAAAKAAFEQTKKEIGGR